MIEPVIAADGHTYEKAALQKWLEFSDESPVTGNKLCNSAHVVNTGTKSIIADALQRR